MDFEVRHRLFLVCLLIILLRPSLVIRAQQPEELDVIGRWLAYSDAENALYHHLAAQALEMLRERPRVSELSGSENRWATYQETIRQELAQAIGPLPERTPLKPVITGILERPDFRVEKVMYQSQPGFFVTAALFVPRNLTAPAPGILYCSGHSAEAFRSPIYQHVIINLVKKGFVVLAFDPFGQGERVQYLDLEIRESRIGGPTLEHSYPGAQALLLGQTVAKQVIWDGIRSLDYLSSRSEVDRDRLGVTGRSGGGTQTVYIAAMDRRVRAAAPECYVTSLRRLLESIGPQDAEQNIPGAIVRGIDHFDLLAIRAPRPLLVIATTRDFFSIQGTRETVQELKQVYTSLRSAEVDLVEDDAPHQSTKLNRIAMYKFFQNALDQPGNPADEPVQIFSLDELRVTRSGQLADSVGGKTVYDLLREEASAMAESRTASGAESMEAVREVARKLAGYREPEPTDHPVFAGRTVVDGVLIEKYLLKGEGDYVLPGLLLLPEGQEKVSGILYLHPAGKAAEARGEMERIVRLGYAVMSFDALGIGELGPGDFRGDADTFRLGRGQYNVWFLANLIGRSLVGVRAGDVVRAARFLQHDDRVLEGITLVGHGTMGPVALHAAAFDPLFSRIAVVGSLLSYQSLALSRFYRPEFIHAVVPGALTAYDLPNLAEVIAPRDLLILDPVDALSQPLTEQEVKEVYTEVSGRYSSLDRRDALQVLIQPDTTTSGEALLNWLGQPPSPR